MALSYWQNCFDRSQVNLCHSTDQEVVEQLSNDEIQRAIKAISWNVFPDKLIKQELVATLLFQLPRRRIDFLFYSWPVENRSFLAISFVSYLSMLHLIKNGGPTGLKMLPQDYHGSQAMHVVGYRIPCHLQLSRQSPRSKWRAVVAIVTDSKISSPHYMTWTHQSELFCIVDFLLSMGISTKLSPAVSIFFRWLLRLCISTTINKYVDRPSRFILLPRCRIRRRTSLLV